MGTCEPLAAYDEVLSSELSNSMFSGKKEIVDIITSLISRGILQERIGELNNKEIKYLQKFGLIRFDDKRALTFASENIKKELVDLRLKLYHEFCYPK